jgi:5,10-methylenetetrahydromethanopterin reductase
MRIAIGVGGEVIGAPLPPPDIVDDVVRAEADGFGSAWSVHFSRGVDALDVLAVAGTRTSRIDLGVGIVPTYPRHPLALAQQAATTQAFCGGRLTLGVGVSHRPVIEDLHGITYARPAAHMRDYLSVLVPLLRDGSVRHRGEFYQVDGGFVVPGTSPVSVLVGALSPLMVQVAGELADGVVTWLAGPRSLGEHIVPRRHAGGRRRGWWRRCRWRSAPTPASPGPPPTSCSPGTRAWTTTGGCSSARARRRRAPWPSRGPRPRSRSS